MGPRYAGLVVCPPMGEAQGIERDDPFGGAYGAALGVRAGDFVFTTVAGVSAVMNASEIASLAS